MSRAVPGPAFPLASRPSFGSALLLAAVLPLAGCTRSSPPAPDGNSPRTAAATPAPKESGATARKESGATAPRVDDETILTWGSGSPGAPRVVVIHGLGDRPESYVDAFSNSGLDAEFLAPRAPRRHGAGYSWFTFEKGQTNEDFARAVATAEAELAPRLAARTGGAPYVVTGFSQGGILSFALAARRPDVVACAVPIAGSLPGALLPTRKSPPVFAVHGADDAVISAVYGRATVDAFRAAGGVAEMDEVPGVGHALPSPLRARWLARLRQCLTLAQGGAHP